MARRNSQLVCQHLENVSRKMLEKYQDIVRDLVRGRNGVYAMYKGTQLYYVGLASSLLRRLKRHLKDSHAGTWDRFSVYLTIGPRYMREMESLLIHIARPPGNRVKGDFINCEDLLTVVRREYHARVKREEDDLFGLDSKSGTKRHKRERSRVKSAGRKAVLADYVECVRNLRATYKGKTLKAIVLRDGRIRFRGKTYTSPSLAATAAVASGNRNGWSFWRYQRAPGDWVALKELGR